MRIGIGTPLVASADPDSWERGAGPKGLADVAAAADRLGYSHLTCSEHVVVPVGHPYEHSTFWDPAATFGFLSAVTERIRLVTYVLIVGLHHPLQIAKRYGTVDMLSNGRLTLGLGVGNEPLEFNVLGAPFDDRGPRAEDALRALRACLSQRLVSYHGPYFDFDDLLVDPHAVQEHVPLWIGGHTRLSLRRAIALADAWIPPPPGHRGPSAAELATMLKTVELPAGFDVGVSPGYPLDPILQPDRCRQEIGDWAGAGATFMTVSFDHSSAEHYKDQLAAFAELGGVSTSMT